MIPSGTVRPGSGLAVAAPALAGCGGLQSALAPAGRGAEQIAQIFWWSAAFAALIWLGVVGLGIWALLGRVDLHPGSGNRLVIGAGAVFPTVVLTVYLVVGLRALPELLAPAPEGSLQIRVVGEQFWWRVFYQGEDGAWVETANELHLPVDEPVQLLLESADVIHSLWVPSLGGKIDMIPGRTNRLTLHPTRTGVFRGACAEFCGASHAHMALDVVVRERAGFDQWLADQAAPALPPADERAERGRALFFRTGCGACHAIRGTPADGAIGPDLTHVGSRRSIAAGRLPAGPAGLARWLSETDHLKPGVRMPAFGMLGPDEVEALATYLDGLR